MYFSLILFITALTVLPPWLVSQATSRGYIRLHMAPVWLPIVAAAVYFISLFLPDIHISSETNTFQQHFIGGGVYTALLFVYFSKLLGWRPHWLLSLTALFASTSALGTLNELLEFTLTKLNITHINISDTSWDLVANTSGAIVTFALWKIVESTKNSVK